MWPCKVERLIPFGVRITIYLTTMATMEQSRRNERVEECPHGRKDQSSGYWTQRRCILLPPDSTHKNILRESSRNPFIQIPTQFFKSIFHQFLVDFHPNFVEFLLSILIQILLNFWSKFVAISDPIYLINFQANFIQILTYFWSIFRQFFTNFYQKFRNHFSKFCWNFWSNFIQILTNLFNQFSIEILLIFDQF